MEEKRTVVSEERSTKEFRNVLSKFFLRFYSEEEFVEKTYHSLNSLGFHAENTIACAGVCRDEITQSLIDLIREKWGESFNLSSLAGMFFAGKTGLLAAMHHAPNLDGRERYVYYALPHVAIDGMGRVGVCKRMGRSGESSACGALNILQKELDSAVNSPASGKRNDERPGGAPEEVIDQEDFEMSLVRRRLYREIPRGSVPDLLELTKITRQVIQTDLEKAVNMVVDTAKSDYAIITGIQIHGPDGNYVWPASCDAVVDGKTTEVDLK